MSCFFKGESAVLDGALSLSVRRTLSYSRKTEAMISKTAEYALRAIVTVAQHQDKSCSAQKISSVTQIPSPYLSKLMQVLVRAGLVRSQRGVRGGFMLTAELSELTMWDVVDAVEPLQRIRECPLGIKSHEAFCPLHQRLDDTMAMVETSLRETTIAELLEAGSVTALCAENEMKRK